VKIRVSLFFLCVFVTVSLFAGEAATKEAAGQPLLDAASDAFPTVAVNQVRPNRLAAHDVQHLDPGDGSYSFGACNCKRKCAANGVQCSFTGDTMNACKIKTDNHCEDCTKDCGT
jgi:hypothetical protein